MLELSTQLSVLFIFVPLLFIFVFLVIFIRFDIKTRRIAKRMDEKLASLENKFKTIDMKDKIFIQGPTKKKITYYLGKGPLVYDIVKYPKLQGDNPTTIYYKIVFNEKCVSPAGPYTQDQFFVHTDFIIKEYFYYGSFLQGTNVISFTRK